MNNLIKDKVYVPETVKEYLTGLRVRTIEQFYSRVYHQKDDFNEGKQVWADELGVTVSELENILTSIEQEVGSSEVTRLQRKVEEKRGFGALPPWLKKPKQ